MSSLTLLPLSPELLEESKFKALAALQRDGYSVPESKLLLEADFAGWLDESESHLPTKILQMLDAASWFSILKNPRESSPGKLYERTVLRLSKQGKVNRRTAAITLSYLPLLVHLVHEFRLSAAGVAEVLNESDQRILLHWKGIERILFELGLAQALDEVKVQTRLQDDRTVMMGTFSDANLATIVEILSFEADSFNLGVVFRSSIEALITPVAGEPFVPYLQTLFYLCVITEYYDHPLEYLYTFKPRGQVANLIFAVFPSVMAAAGNPILNNFKAIDRLSQDWARSRDDYPQQAKALVELIVGLSSLSYSSRRYMAGKIRSGLLRLIEIKCPANITIAPVTSITIVKHVLARISTAETRTRGVIEQRISDFLAALDHSADEWRQRGLGDAVNATNTSSLKLGDVDFQRVDSRRCVAVEAHAGKLTPVYFKEHVRTLKRNLPKRLEEWEKIADLSEWHLKIIFVVHEDACGGDINLSGLPVDSSLQIRSYGEWSKTALCREGVAEKHIVRLFNRWVIGVVNANHTPYPVKQKMAELLKRD